MLTPAATFSFILATIYGAVFQFIVGGDIRRLALYLVSGWLGFALGHILGVLLGLDIMSIGVIRIVPATVGAWVALFGARFLVLRPIRKGQP